MLVRRALELALCLVLSGCGGQPTGVSIVEDQGEWPDSVRYESANGKLVPYAMLWRSGTLNLWYSVHEATWCGPQQTYHRVRASLVGRADVPPLWADGDSIHGVWTSVYADSGTAVTGGGFTAVLRGGQTELGALVAVAVEGPCGSRLIETEHLLVRQP